MQRLRWFVLAVFVVGILLCLAGCKPSGELKATRTVTENDFGRTIELLVGNTLGIVLLEPAGQRYKWACSWVPTQKMELVREVLIREAPGAGGAGGERHFILEVTQPGRIIVSVRRGPGVPRSYIVQAR